MQFSHEWKTLWPISSVHALPLLLQSPSLGPLCFNPIPKTLKFLLYSPSVLSPPFLPPPPSLSLPRFLKTSTCHDSPVLPTSCYAIAASFNDNPFSNCDDTVRYNRLESLRCPGDRVLVFFSTGENLDRVGFLVLSMPRCCATLNFELRILEPEPARGPKGSKNFLADS